jgi:hypothetical protein
MGEFSRYDVRLTIDGAGEAERLAAWSLFKNTAGVPSSLALGTTRAPWERGRADITPRAARHLATPAISDVFSIM